MKTSDRSSELPRRSKSTLSIEGKELSVGERIKQIGFGAYQWQVFIFCMGSLLCESAQLSTITGIQNGIFSEFNIVTKFGQSLLVSLLYLGFTFGTIASGTIGDSRGRRLPMLLGYVGMAVTQVLMWAVPWLEGLYFLVFVLGFFAGIGIPAAVTLLTEVMPDAVRGFFGAALCLGFCFGELWTAVGLQLFLPDLATGYWRNDLLWAAIPPLLLVIAGLGSRVTRYDSPHFLAVHNDKRHLHKALNLIAEMNGRLDLVLGDELLPQEAEMIEHETKDMPFSEVLQLICSGDLGSSTLVLSIMFFSYNFGYYGTVDFFPIGWSQVGLQGVDKATTLIYTALLGFGSVPIAMFSMTTFLRRPTVCFMAFSCAVAALCLQGLVAGNLYVGFAGVGAFKLLWMTFQMITMNLPNEIYPTRVSVWGWSIVCFFGRIGCILAPIVISSTDRGYLVALACALSISAIVVWILPETKDIDLEAIDSMEHCKPSKSMNYGSFALKSETHSA